MEMNIGMPKDVVKPSVTILNNLLSDQFVLLAKTWNFHWNIKGPSFGTYHAFMEKLYTQLFEGIDATAERVRALDGRPIGSLHGCLDHTRVKEYDDHKDLPSAIDMLKILLEDYETVIRETRSDLADLESKKPLDEGTISYLQNFIEEFEKTTWMIRAHVE
ncbi:MAG: Dps family protein [Bacteroidales bacterium]